MNDGFSVAIDGPVASGKGTLASALAKKLNGVVIDTGAMYRAVALLSIERGVDIHNEDEVSKVLSEINLKFGDDKFILNDRDISTEIRSSEVSTASAVVASYTSVRTDMVSKQQQIAKEEMAKGGIVVMEGRDIGTKVLPDSQFKLFLKADPKVRAIRRMEQYRRKGAEKSFVEILEETKNRDEMDMEREMDPLPSNPEELGYFVLDNSLQSEEESIKSILEELTKRGLIK